MIFLLLSRVQEKIKKILLDLFLPKQCLGCKQPDTYLCRACFNSIILYPNNTCFFCKRITWQGKICIECQKQTYLDRVISATEYKNPLIQELIRAFKYHYVKELAPFLSQLLIKSSSECWTSHVQHNAVIMPIPLHRIRERTRGFNQAELLAKEISNYFNLPLETNILKRTIPTEPQANIKNNDEKRKANIKGVFEINPEYQVDGKIIVLIDDVATTGATLIEAAKILKKSGAKQIWALVVAKG